MRNRVSFQDVDQWARRSRLAMQAGALLCVLTLTGVIYTHARDASVEPATSAPPASKSSPDTQPAPYDLPSQLELKATEPAEPIQAF